MMHPVLLCGGSGTRLWPLSRESCPKQFVDLGEGRTLFKDTLRRIAAIPGLASPLIVCNNEHRFFASASLMECDMQARLILEPQPRNTAPAVALAALAVHEQDPDGILLILPSDHLLKNEERFAEAVQKACPMAESGHIMTFGIEPSSPTSAYGYIRKGDPLPNGGFAVARFVEKPDAATARTMLDSGEYLWNSGMFLVSASTFLEELEKYEPLIYEKCSQAWENRRLDGAFVRPASRALVEAPAVSIDYAVMERTERAAVYPLEVEWNDLGSWESLYQTGEKDSSGNVDVGDILEENTRNCYLHASHRLLAALDVQDLAIIETRDAVLVAHRDSVQDVRKLVARLNDMDRPETRWHPLVQRPWGSYECLVSGPRFQVKEIIVNPGAQLSLQMHYHRAEHWVIVSGTAEVTNGGTTTIYTENQSTYIPVGTVHRLKNPGRIPLIMIEIQSGNYLGEDDIVRLEDEYGRT